MASAHPDKGNKSISEVGGTHKVDCVILGDQVIVRMMGSGRNLLA
jgi:hypothetical protein